MAWRRDARTLERSDFGAAGSHGIDGKLHVALVYVKGVGHGAEADEHRLHGRGARGIDISRPAVSEKRLSLTPGGKVRYELKLPYRDGTTPVVFKPLGEPK